ncbi:MAG: DUF4358 domain-containing protein [Clostridiales bacterium]|nr:DUF4358 domain-containing protein [Clostridiales bacterium]
MMARLVTELQDVPETRMIFYNDANPDTENFMTQEYITKIYYQDFEINALCAEYAVFMGSGGAPYEIHILKARATSNMPEILSALQTRKDLLQSKNAAAYNPDAYDVTMTAKVFSKEKYAVLLVTKDNEQAEKLIQKLI